MENKSKFQFKGYSVKKSLIEISGETTSDLNLDFIPSGIVKNSSNEFVLDLIVVITDDEGFLNIEVDFIGHFSFESNDATLTPFIITNAPAILFPYIRAYISSLTALSGGKKALILPTLNMTRLKDKLSKNIEYID